MELTGSVEMTVRLESAARVHLVLAVDKLAVTLLTAVGLELTGSVELTVRLVSATRVHLIVIVGKLVGKTVVVE